MRAYKNFAAPHNARLRLQAERAKVVNLDGEAARACGRLECARQLIRVEQTPVRALRPLQQS
eukprot:4437462-Pleurochrysis_carterae.AAC.6